MGETARAYRWMLKFDHVYELPADEAEHYLRAWRKGARRSRLQPIVDFADMVSEYWLGIVRWFQSRSYGACWWSMERVAALRAEIEELERRVGQDSQNSQLWATGGLRWVRCLR